MRLKMNQLESDYGRVETFLQDIERESEAGKTLEIIGDVRTEQGEQIKQEIEECVRGIQQDWEEVAERFLNTEKVPQTIREYLEKKELLKPNFTLHLNGHAKNLLQFWGYGQEAKTAEQVLQLRLPKPLDAWWWKGGKGLWGTGAQRIHEEDIAWGALYRKFIDIFWKHARRVTSIEMRRINPPEQHNVGEYYYLFKISPKPRERLADRWEDW